MARFPGNRQTRLLCVFSMAVGIVIGAAAIRWTNAPEPLARIAPTKSVDVTQRQLNLLAIADWGQDTKALRAVADKMGAHAEHSEVPIDGVLLAGDNFYGPLKGAKDPEWKRLFEDMFPATKLNVPFYAILGNNDYDDGKDAFELLYASDNPSSRWKMPARWYRLELPKEKPLVTILMLDSNVAVIGKERWAEQTAWLEQQLALPRTTPWLVACAHHPIYGGPLTNPDEQIVNRLWKPLFVKAGVDFYIHGHHHQMAHLRESIDGMDYITTGGGGAALKTFQTLPGTLFAQETHGFVDLRFGETTADINYRDERGRLIHAFSRHSDASSRPSSQSSAR